MSKVIVAFLATGYLVFLLLLCYYLVVFDPEDRGVGKDGDQDSIKDEGGYRPNSIDIGFLAFVRRHGRNLAARFPPFPLKVNLEGVLSLVGSISHPNHRNCDSDLRLFSLF